MLIVFPSSDIVLTSWTLFFQITRLLLLKIIVLYFDRPCLLSLEVVLSWIGLDESNDSPKNVLGWYCKVWNFLWKIAFKIAWVVHYIPGIFSFKNSSSFSSPRLTSTPAGLSVLFCDCMNPVKSYWQSPVERIRFKTKISRSRAKKTTIISINWITYLSLVFFLRFFLSGFAKNNHVSLHCSHYRFFSWSN